ncbi:MAG: aldose 1-epimerase, partial [Casimicrobiaceae bacterium]
RVMLLPAIGGAVGGFDWNGAPVLRRMPDDAIAAGDVRLTAAYPLVPWSNRIRDARLVANGVSHALRRNFGEHPHAIHGVGWQRAWTATQVDATHAQLALSHDAQGDALSAWPWAFDATQAFTLAAHPTRATLATTLTICNRGEHAFPFGLGWHPFFPRAASTTLRFAADGVWHNDPTQLPLTHTTVPAQWDFSAARAIDAIALDNVFTGWRGHAVLDDEARGLRIGIAADTACRCLVVFAPPQHDYVAIEPVTHETDAFNRRARGERGTGTRMLPPDGAFSCTMRVTVEPLHAT